MDTFVLDAMSVNGTFQRTISKDTLDVHTVVWYEISIQFATKVLRVI